MFQSEATPDCGVQVIQLAKSPDPYNLTAAARVCKIDTAVDLAAFNAKIAGNPASLFAV